MAEIAIPLLALGGLYIASNQDKKKKGTSRQVEGFQNNMQYSYPSIDAQPVINYPTTANVNDSNVNKYPNANQATDKYYDQQMYQDIGVSTGAQQNYSLSGRPIDKTDFKHNNMVPFFGGKIKGATVDLNTAESMLDNMQGQGSQLIRKQEQAPLFQPHQNLQFANGAPNMSDFMQSRVVPAMRIANVKPWEEQQVGPGLNKGFSANGSAGFNSGMEARETWLPKTVDELRVDTNPKLSYGLQGHQGPASSQIKTTTTPEMYPKVEKHLPDSYYTVGPEKWFTTTGVEKAPTIRSAEMLNDVNRTTTSLEYYGNGGLKDREASYAKGEYQDSRRNILDEAPIMPPAAPGMFSPSATDYGSKSYSNLPNNRTTTKNANDFVGGVSGLMKAIVAPLLDALRPSRKENVVGNSREAGNVSGAIYAGQVYNPADRTKTTIREMTEANLDGNHLNVENQSGNSNAYLVTQYQPVNLHRDTTTQSYSGNASSVTHEAPQSYDAAYMQHNNVNKTYANRPHQGGTQIFNQNDNISIQRRDADRDNNRLCAPSGGMNQQIPSKDLHGKLTGSVYYNETAGSERNHPDILTAFKNNPYTHSLNSWA